MKKKKSKTAHEPWDILDWREYFQKKYNVSVRADKSPKNPVCIRSKGSMFRTQHGTLRCGACGRKP